MSIPPLSAEVAAILRSDSTAALGALMVIGGSNPELLTWAARNGFAEEEPRPELRRRRYSRKVNSCSRRRRSKLNGGDCRLARRDRDDENLLQAMRDSPDGPINDWAAAIGKSRSSTVTALHRLRDADLAESVEGKWRLTAPPEPHEPAPPLG